MNDRHQLLNDREFWTRLEYAATQWLENSEDVAFRRFWVDGFLPDSAKDTNFGADFEGTAWVGIGARRQDQFRFIASLPQKMLGRQAPPFVIEQLSLDEAQQTLQLTLAMPDSTPDSKVLFRLPEEET